MQQNHDWTKKKKRTFWISCKPNAKSFTQPWLGRGEVGDIQNLKRYLVLRQVVSQRRLGNPSQPQPLTRGECGCLGRGGGASAANSPSERRWQVPCSRFRHNPPGSCASAFRKRLARPATEGSSDQRFTHCHRSICIKAMRHYRGLRKRKGGKYCACLRSIPGALSRKVS